MRAATYSSAPLCSKGFQAFWASSARVASTTSYPSCSAAALSWPSAFSWAAHIFKSGRSLLAFGSNSAVKRTASPPLTLAVSPHKTRFIQFHAYQNGIALLKRCSARGLPFLWVSPGGTALVCGLFGLQRLRSKRYQLSFCKHCAASVAPCFFAVRAHRQMGASRFGVWV